MIARWQRAALVGFLCLALVGCSGAVAATPAATPTKGAAGACLGSGCALGAGATGVQVFVEPGAGETPILHAIQGATISVWVEVYLLTDHAVIHALEETAQRGVEVRVLVEQHPYGGGDVGLAQTLAELAAAGAQTRGANPAYRFTHEKALVIDNATAYILTANLTRSALGGSSAVANREYGVIDTNSADVAEVRAIFQADWQRTMPTLTDPNLVVSPINAREKISALLASAHTSLHIEDEEMYDQPSEDAMIAAARRGVDVAVVLPAPTDSSGSADVARLVQGGVHVRYIIAPYMHAKLIVTDGARAFVGSENFSGTSLDGNRELGLVIADTTALAIFESTFTRDWSVARDATV